MDWIERAKTVFTVQRPNHFTDYKHCEECAEHDHTLRNAKIDTIGLEELGNPGWDPICFCSDEGKKYYMPSLVKLSLTTIGKEFYLSQMLFHLESNGDDNNFYKSCNAAQRRYVASFIEFLINNYTDDIESNMYSDQALRVYEIWTKA